MPRAAAIDDTHAGVFVRGEGPTPADIMLVGGMPGKFESAKRRPFCGFNGTELDRFFDGYALPQRHELYATYLLKVQLPKGADPTSEQIAEHQTHLLKELRQVRPSIVVALGRLASQWFVGDRHNLATLHGIAHPMPADCPAAAICPDAIVYTAYSPGDGMRSPETYAHFVADMHRLGLLVQGKLAARPADTLPTDYRLLEGADAVNTTLQGCAGPVFVDTEGWPDNPWSVQITTAPGNGFLIRATDTAGLTTLRDYFRRVRPLVVFHYLQHDVKVLRAMGIDLIADGLPLTDTMIMAYLIGESQGLKALGYRLAGMEQQEYEELTRDANNRVATEWLADIAWGRFPRKDGPKPPELERALRLVERMILKESPRGLRERWADCRAREILQDDMDIVEEMPEATLDMLPIADAVRYGCRDTDVTARVYGPLCKTVETLGLQRPLEIDMAIVPLVDRMEQIGLPADADYFRDLGYVLASEYAVAVDALSAKAGRELNPNSSDQVAAWLYGDLELPCDKKTSGGKQATGKRLLEALAKDFSLAPEQREAVSMVLDAREIQKLKSTYCDSLAQWIAADGRIHPRLILTRTATGRTAAKDPNVLAIPKHSLRGKMVRGGFRVPPGRLLAEWDLSQIDLRALAIDSGDERMIEQFNSGHDFHKAGAAARFSKAPEDVTSDERFRQKKVNFAIPMGSTEYGLCDSFHMDGITSATPEQCATLLRAWHRQYPQASAYIQDKHAEARRTGMVRTWTGRLRYLEGVHSADKYVRSEALRQAQATPIQGGARDIVKLWLAEIWKRLPDLRRRYYVEPVCDVHDSILLECDEDAYAATDAMVKDALDAIQQFPIPITMEGSFGESWGDL